MSDVGLAARLKQAREAAGLSQGQVARLLDFHRPTVTAIENGSRKVSADELTRFADTYDVSPMWLLGMQTERMSLDNPRLQLAAREMSKLKEADLERLLAMLATMRES